MEQENIFHLERTRILSICKIDEKKMRKKINKLFGIVGVGVGVVGKLRNSVVKRFTH